MMSDSSSHTLQLAFWMFAITRLSGTPASGFAARVEAEEFLPRLPSLIQNHYVPPIVETGDCSDDDFIS